MNECLIAVDLIVLFKSTVCPHLPYPSLPINRTNSFFSSMCAYLLHIITFCVYFGPATEPHRIAVSFVTVVDVVIVLSEEEIQTNFQEISIVVVFFYFSHVRRKGLRSWFHFYFCRFFSNVNRWHFLFLYCALYNVYVSKQFSLLNTNQVWKMNNIDHTLFSSSSYFRKIRHFNGIDVPSFQFKCFSTFFIRPFIDKSFFVFFIRKLPCYD